MWCVWGVELTGWARARAHRVAGSLLSGAGCVVCVGSGAAASGMHRCALTIDPTVPYTHPMNIIKPILNIIKLTVNNVIVSNCEFP